MKVKWQDISAIAVSLMIVGLVFYMVFMAPLQRWQGEMRAAVGKPETEVLRLHGEPYRVVRSEEELDWLAQGYVPRPTHSIKARVLVYSHLNMIAYLFVDREGRMEHVEFAGT
jgi:hypothetical protein